MDLPRFSDPWALVLLLLIPWSLWLGMGIQSLSRLRKVMTLTLRTVILTAMILALAGMEWVKTDDDLAVFFLLDHSDSVHENARRESAQWVRNTAESNMTDKDKAGVIVFGEDASIELSVDTKMGMRDVASYVGGVQTDLAAAIRLAMAAFPQGHMKRIVIYSDGNETKGSALEEVKLAQAAGVDVQIVPIHVTTPKEVRVRDVALPNQVNADEPFQLRVVVSAEADTSGTLRVYQRVGDKRLSMPAQDVTLRKGDNTFILQQEMRTSGFYEYEVSIEAEGDTMLENNSAQAFTIIQGEPRVLFVANVPEDGEYVLKALAQEGIATTSIVPADFPMSLAQIQNYDVVIMPNVSATDITSDQMKLIEAMVRDLGIGFIMIGGPESFGAGGYLDTPVERALPVSMDIKQRKILPKGALALIMHTCEFPNGNAWAREISLAALNVLSSQDLMGILAYQYPTAENRNQQGDSWMHPLEAVGDKRALTLAITEGSKNIGDMPSYGPTLEMAYEALLETDAAAKRILIISDGDAAPPRPGLVSYIAEAGIAISTIIINPHSGNDESKMRGLAQDTGGEYYFVKDPKNLPQIFTKEASIVKRGLMIEEPFSPAFFHDSELLLGLANHPFPDLLGYVVTSAKDSATLPLVSHEDDPVLAHWRYGLGKSVAFTSDVTSRWAVNWLGWEGFDRFWVQTVRWATRETTPTDFQVDTWIENGKGHVKVDAMDGEGNFINFLQPHGVVTGPAPDYKQSKVTLQQTEPGIYESTFPVADNGVYMMNLLYTQQDGTTGSIPSGLALSYSPEYNYTSTNVPLLEQLANVNGNVLVESTFNPFVHDMVASPFVKPLWDLLLLMAVCLFPVEIFIRRVMLPWGLMWDETRAFLRKIPGVKYLVRQPKPRAQAVTGAIMTGANARRDFAAAATLYDEVLDAEGHVVVSTDTVDAGDSAVSAEPAEAPKSDYTQKLLEAKQKAQDSKQRRIDRLDKD